MIDFLNFLLQNRLYNDVKKPHRPEQRSITDLITLIDKKERVDEISDDENAGRSQTGDDDSSTGSKYWPYWNEDCGVKM